MYIRVTYKTKADKKYIQHQLVKSVRTSAGPRQEIVLNMQQLDLDKSKHKALAIAIEEKLLNQTSLFIIDEEIDKLAEHYAAIIVQNRMTKQSEDSQSRVKSKNTTEPQYQHVDINSLKNSTSRTYGGENLVNYKMDEYKIDDLFQKLGFTEKQVQYSKMLIAGRMLHPGSERETARWLNNHSSYPEIVGFKTKIHDTGLHRAAMSLYSNHEIVEDYLSSKARGLFSLEEKIILYDLTNTYFESSKKGSKTCKFGSSKDKRTDCPLLSLALTIDEEGFPKRSKVYEGNVSEPSTLETILSSISVKDGKKRKTIVMDAGIATEENLEKIKGKYDYIVVSRKKSLPRDIQYNAQEDKKLLLSDKKTMLTLKTIRTDDETYVICHSEAKEIKEGEILKQRQERFEKALDSLEKGFSQPRKMKNYAKVLEKIARLKEQYKVGNLYEIKVQHNKSQTGMA